MQVENFYKKIIHNNADLCMNTSLVNSVFYILVNMQTDE